MRPIIGSCSFDFPEQRRMSLVPVAKTGRVRQPNGRIQGPFKPNIANKGNNMATAAAQNVTTTTNKIKQPPVQSQQQQLIKTTPTSSRKALTTINEATTIINSRRVNFDTSDHHNRNLDIGDGGGDEENDDNKLWSSRKRQPFTDSMFDQALKESAIDRVEKKLAAFLQDTLQPVRHNLNKLPLRGLSGPELRRLMELTNSISAEERELDVQRICLQKSRDTFLRELANYESVVTSKLDKLSGMGEQCKELVTSLENSAKCASNPPEKPLMVDKEIQVIPERTLLKSPLMDYTSRIGALPASPILRTSTNKQTKAEHRVIETPKRLFF